MPLVIRPRAAEDIQQAYAWYEEAGQGLGERFITAVEQVLGGIEAYPRSPRSLSCREGPCRLAEQSMRDPQPTCQDIPPQRAAVLRCQGDFQSVPEAIMALVDWMTTEGLPTEEVLIGATYALQADGAEPEWEVWGTLPDSVPEREAAAGKPGIKTVPGFRAAVIINVGPYGQTSAAYERLFTWIEEQGLSAQGLVQEVYLSDPGLVPPFRLETEIRVILAA